MHPFKEEKRLNLPKFAPAAGYLGIKSTVIAYSKRKKSSKIWKGVVIKIEEGVMI